MNKRKHTLNQDYKLSLKVSGHPTGNSRTPSVTPRAGEWNPSKSRRYDESYDAVLKSLETFLCVTPNM